jgi:hypothetical protein
VHKWHGLARVSHGPFGLRPLPRSGFVLQDTRRYRTRCPAGRTWALQSERTWGHTPSAPRRRPASSRDPQMSRILPETKQHLNRCRPWGYGCRDTLSLRASRRPSTRATRAVAALPVVPAVRSTEARVHGFLEQSSRERPLAICMRFAAQRLLHDLAGHRVGEPAALRETVRGEGA